MNKLILNDEAFVAKAIESATTIEQLNLCKFGINQVRFMAKDSTSTTELEEIEIRLIEKYVLKEEEIIERNKNIC